MDADWRWRELTVFAVHERTGRETLYDKWNDMRERRASGQTQRDGGETNKSGLASRTHMEKNNPLVTTAAAAAYTD